MKIEKLVTVAEITKDSLKQGNSVFTFGVGGNAATATHFAGELAGKY